MGRFRTVMFPLIGTTLALIAFPLSTAMADTSFFTEDFDAEPGDGDGASSESHLDHNGFLNWTVSNGTVDLIMGGDFGIACASSGKCIDLDGSDRDAGVLTSSVFSFDPGFYTLEFKLGGVSPAFASAAAMADNIVDVSLGTLFSDSFTIEWGAAFQSFRADITVESFTSANLAFANRGADNFGALLDDVAISIVPEPGTAFLLGIGLAALAYPRSRMGQ